MTEKNDFPAEFYHMAARECLRRAVREFDEDESRMPESLEWFTRCCDVLHADRGSENTSQLSSASLDTFFTDSSQTLDSKPENTESNASLSDSDSSEITSAGSGWPTLSFGNVFDDVSAQTGISLDDIDK